MGVGNDAARIAKPRDQHVAAFLEGNGDVVLHLLGVARRRGIIAGDLGEQDIDAEGFVGAFLDQLDLAAQVFGLHEGRADDPEPTGL